MNLKQLMKSREEICDSSEFENIFYVYVEDGIYVNNTLKDSLLNYSRYWTRGAYLYIISTNYNEAELRNILREKTRPRLFLVTRERIKDAIGNDGKIILGLALPSLQDGIFDYVQEQMKRNGLGYIAGI